MAFLAYRLQQAGSGLPERLRKGRNPYRDRIRLYNAACAITFLAFRVDVPPEQKSCGRTLAQDLRWVRAALVRLR
jgi:hypothetical protein